MMSSSFSSSNRETISGLRTSKKKQGMGGTAPQEQSSKGNLFMTGGAGRRAKRDNTAGKERVAVLS